MTTTFELPDKFTCVNRENHVSGFPGFDRIKCPFCNNSYVRKPKEEEDETD